MSTEQVHARIPALDLVAATPHNDDAAEQLAVATGDMFSGRTGRSTARIAPKDSARPPGPPLSSRALDISISRQGNVIVRHVDANDAEGPGGSSPRAILPESEDRVLIASLEASLASVTAELSSEAQAKLAAKEPQTSGTGDAIEDEETAAEAALRAATAPKPRARYIVVLDGALVAARTYVAYVLSHWLFDAVMMVVILYSCATLTVDSGDLATCVKQPGAAGDRCRAIKSFLAWSDFEVMLVFVGEATAQMFVRGLWGHPRSYFRSPWRVLDCLVAAFSVAAEIVQSSQYRALRALRAVRALRPLRLVSRFPQLQLVVDVSRGKDCLCD